MEIHDRRHYKRSDHLYCTAKMSIDGKKWQEADLDDLSSGGLRMRTAESFQVNDVLWFNLEIQNFLVEFSIKTQGIIRRRTEFENEYTYGVAFINLSPDDRIRIDENVRMDRPVTRDTYNFD